MILIGIGSNLAHPDIGEPRAVCEAATAAIAAENCEVLASSRWFRSAPVPVSDQPDFINGVISVATMLTPADLLAELHRIENRFGRERSVPNAARILDLDLLAYHDTVSEPGNSPILPHPRMTERAFVLYPLRDIAPDWCHPESGQDLTALIRALPGDQTCVPDGR
jgi:2-amino-4-hydroxy-6-hydroxymethyldihydropteridine diphosphokinase